MPTLNGISPTWRRTRTSLAPPASREVTSTETDLRVKRPAQISFSAGASGSMARSVAAATTEVSRPATVSSSNRLVA